jgi:hypothetical protein
MYAYQQYVKCSNRSILILLHVLYLKRGSHCDAHHCFPVACCLLFFFALMMYVVKISEGAHVWLPAVCQMVKQVYIDHNSCAVFKKSLTRWCPPLFSCSLFLVDTEAILCHWWYMESKWVKKPIYGYQEYSKWSNRSILIILHVLNS